jgi:isoleucyl-tRNA synthetase
MSDTSLNPEKLTSPASGDAKLNSEPKSDAATREEAILAFWQEHQIFEKSLEKEAPNGDFIFYEGPPTANGKPGVHHMESRSFKDAIPRYKTMRGYRVPRRAGWDTHGLPVELEVEKQLGFKGKKDIEVYGIAAFNKKCRESVFEYIDLWQKFTKRLGYWVDQEKAYFTFDVPYMESLFSIFKKISDDGRVYKDYRVVPWCARCGTALSTHELAQGYADVKDLSVTAKFELVDEPGTYLLAWTTTPWTLPGNVGLAVGEKIAYVEYEKAGEKVILAKALAEKVLPEGWTFVADRAAADLLGKEYKPLYTIAQDLAPESEKPKFEKAFRVYSADFVTTEDGTGIVHTAVMYGQEDFDLGQKVGLPKVHLVGPDGKFIAGTGFLEGRFVKEEDGNGKPTLAVDILDDLRARGLFFSQENHLHSYPFCWRCKTPLIYYARDSWYIRMSELRETLVAENQKVHWEPAHIRDGRMGDWLKGDKDWAISRERYWGTPLPIWQDADGIERLTIGSIDELKAQTKKSGNTYFLMRHGEAEQNVARIVSSALDDEYGLTELGKKQVHEGVQKIADTKFTHIYASPLCRTRESAELAADVLGISRDAIRYDDRLAELKYGDLNNGSFDVFLEYRHDKMKKYGDSLPGGESYLDAKRRFGEFIYEIERTHANETILIVSHGVAIESLLAVVSGAGKLESRNILDYSKKPHAQPQQLDFVPLPHNDDYELDLHRPYIDDVVLLGAEGAELRRVHEVMDVWFDSGSMPFAQDHYPFENKEWIDTKGFPADFISEAIDQTRGWFYTLLAVGVLMGKGTPYKNVICLGHLLDEHGLKMSKSKGNVVEPMAAIERFGADTLRFWMYSVNQPGDSKNFDEKTVTEVANKVFNPFVNTLAFYETHRDSILINQDAISMTHVMDRWIRARFARAAQIVTESTDRYDLFTATRELREFIGDLSQWYVRRSRDRMRSAKDSAEALATLRVILRDTSMLLAPFAPFTAEHVYQKVRLQDDPESVHLCAWPEAGAADMVLIEDMVRVRAIASEALMLRQKVGIKVRQPLAKLFIPTSPSAEGSTVAELSSELLELIKEEVNVREIEYGGPEMRLDTELTPELVREGDVREFMRALADARKAEGFAAKDAVSVIVSEAAHEVLEGAVIQGIASLTFGDVPPGSYSATLSFGTISFMFVESNAGASPLSSDAT